MSKFVKVKIDGEAYVTEYNQASDGLVELFNDEGDCIGDIPNSFVSEVIPELPTTPGSVIRLSDGRFALFMGELWWETHDQYLEPDELGPNWELIHDAGEEK